MVIAGERHSEREYGLEDLGHAPAGLVEVCSWPEKSKAKSGSCPSAEIVR